MGLTKDLVQLRLLVLEVLIHVGSVTTGLVSEINMYVNIFRLNTDSNLPL